MLACISVSRAEHLAQQPPFGGDIQFPESLVQTLIEAFSRPGDIVIDPFAGYGTTARRDSARSRVDRDRASS